MGGLSTVDKRLIYYLSGDLGDSPAPYADLAARLGLTEDDVLAAIRRFRDQGLIRRFGATLWHQRSGFTANAMVVFQIAPGRAGECGEKLARRSYVSHCYLRRPTPGWPFNLYAMIHADSQTRLRAMAEEMAAETGAAEWRMLESLRELKKVSVRYFADQAEAETSRDQG
jgi:DNA-binding Lrp family transcriptional regulator